MLEKIVNINPGSDYKKAAGNPKYYKKVNTFHFSGSMSNDSLYISPATSFLSSLGWKLKKLQKDSEKIYLLFELDGFEFETNLFLADLNQQVKIDYKVKKNIHGFATEIIVTVSISAPIQSSVEKIDYNIKLNALAKFFEQFKSISVKKPNIITEHDVIESMVSDHKKSITSEFNNVNKCIINFLEKYVSYKPTFHHSVGDDGGVIVKSIHIQ